MWQLILHRLQSFITLMIMPLPSFRVLCGSARRAKADYHRRLAEDAFSDENYRTAYERCAAAESLLPCIVYSVDFVVTAWDLMSSFLTGAQRLCAQVHGGIVTVTRRQEQGCVRPSRSALRGLPLCTALRSGVR